MLLHLTFNLRAFGTVDAKMAMLLSLFCLGLCILACVCFMVLVSRMVRQATTFTKIQKNGDKQHKTGVARISHQGNTPLHSS
jgi:hypothetical protein